jgi:hypothetical protein
MSQQMKDPSALPLPVDVRILPPAKRLAYLTSALERALILAKTEPYGEAILTPFSELLKYVVDSSYCGGCHDTSAVMHVLLAEAGVESTLCIGEVGVGVGRLFFDHSWIEVRGQVFDVAVCMPHPDGEPVGGPVFGNADLATGALTALKYGAISGKGIDDAAQPALQLDLRGYSEVQPYPDIWTLSVEIANRCGNERATVNAFRERYGKVRRSFRA